MTPGTLVEFFQDRKILCGLCLKADKKGLHVLGEDNKEVGLSESRILHSLPDFMNPQALREDVVMRLRDASARREDARKDVSLEDLWQLLQEDRRKYTPLELARIYFSEDATAEQVSGMVRALRDDRIYFERKGDHFVPTSPEQVERVLQSIRAEAEKELERDEMVRWIQQIGQIPKPEPPPFAPRYLRYLKDCATLGSEAPRFKEMTEILRRAGLSQNDAAFQVLVKAGIWDADEDLLLHKLQVPIEFPTHVLEEAAAVRREFEASNAWMEGREDLRGERTITVDDVHTTEMDDALSMVEEPEGSWRVAIHISDVAHFVRPGSIMDKEALHRATSLYFPDRRVRMLPPTISEELCSLRQGIDMPAVSVLVRLTADGTLLESRVVDSIVRISERLDYEMVDARLAEDAYLLRLYELAKALKARRLAAGALHIPFPRVDVFVGPDRSIEVVKDDGDTPSHVMVSEFMILANQVVGRICFEEQIPAVYRSQDAPNEGLVVPEVVGPLEAFRMRRFLKKGEASIKANRHHGLGVDYYVQFTSPIRRYIDLAIHRQLKSKRKTGAPFYTRSQIEDIMATSSGPLENAELLERSRKTYWILKHLEAHVWQTREAVVLQTFHDRYLVQLLDGYIISECQPRSDGKHPQPGDVVTVKIEVVWPREGVVRLTSL